MIKINLLPIREARRKADVRQQMMMLGGVVACTVVAAFMFHQVLMLDIRDSRERVAFLKNRLEEFKPQRAQVDEFKTKEQEIQQKLDVIAKLERSRSGPVHILDELATHIPQRVWLTKLTAENGGVELEGMSLDNELVASFLTSLGRSEYFGSVELVETELRTVDELKLNTFIIQAQILDPGANEAAEATTPAVGQG